MTKVELFEAIRRDRFVHEKSIRRIARERGVHRRMVRDALESAIPPPRRCPDRAPTVLTVEFKRIIDDWLEADREAPRKQRHTARQVWRRLTREHGFTGAESTVRRYAGRRKRELCLGREAYVPLAHEPGQEAEVDWYEAAVDFPWGREVVHFFQMRACYSGRELHMAFPHETQQALLEGHNEAFAYFGRTFHKVRYDNLGSAVVKILRGRRREETARFVALRSHYLFETEFCRPGKEGAHEKGGVEGGVGRFRRTHLVPVPKAESYEDLNRQLLDACAEDDLRKIEGRRARIIDDWEDDFAPMRALPAEPFPTALVGTVGVDAKGCCRVRTNRYSVPIVLAHREVEYRLHAHSVEFVRGGHVVARHPRLLGRHALRLELDHYIELLWHKPGALKRSLALRQARDRGEWPEAYDTLIAGLDERFDDSEAARQLLAVLMLHREYTADEVLVAVELALEHGCYDAGAISVLARRFTEDEPTAQPLTGLGQLQAYDRPALPLDAYDALLTRSSGMEVH